MLGRTLAFVGALTLFSYALPAQTIVKNEREAVQILEEKCQDHLEHNIVYVPESCTVYDTTKNNDETSTSIDFRVLERAIASRPSKIIEYHCHPLLQGYTIGKFFEDHNMTFDWKLIEGLIAMGDTPSKGDIDSSFYLQQEINQKSPTQLETKIYNMLSKNIIKYDIWPLKSRATQISIAYSKTYDENAFINSENALARDVDQYTQFRENIFIKQGNGSSKELISHLNQYGIVIITIEGHR